jgi:hypothetical protein
MPDGLVFSALVPKSFGAKVILDLHDPMPELMQTIFGMPEGSFGVRLQKHLKIKCWLPLFDYNGQPRLQADYSSRGCRPDKIAVVMNSEDRVFRFKDRVLPTLTERCSAPFSSCHGSLVPEWL